MINIGSLTLDKQDGIYASYKDPKVMQPREPSEARQAVDAWLAGDYERARELYSVCVAKAALPGAGLGPNFYLSEWARHEASIGNREAFERLFAKVFASEPDAPFWRLCYARDTWTELKDEVACHDRIGTLEALLASDRWNRTLDLAPRAYAQKIATLKAWLRGEPGGPIWP
ncbi:MAG: hypothetical protein EPO06_00105 [Burkholderiaceae bacterium]|nr:MAG: hypothetical protein EPO06_00105 [Burkholderiaceae bacterium]